MKSGSAMSLAIILFAFFLLNPVQQAGLLRIIYIRTRLVAGFKGPDTWEAANGRQNWPGKAGEHRA